MRVAYYGYKGIEGTKHLRCPPHPVGSLNLINEDSTEIRKIYPFKFERKIQPEVTKHLLGTIYSLVPPFQVPST